MIEINDNEDQYRAIFRVIDSYFDNPVNFKELYPVELINKLSKQFFTTSEASLKFVKEYYKHRPTLRDFAINYKEFYEYSKNYEEKINYQANPKILKAILQEVVRIETKISGSESSGGELESESKKASKLRFLFDYISYKYFSDEEKV